jgi:hypothetical protein
MMTGFVYARWLHVSLLVLTFWSDPDVDNLSGLTVRNFNRIIQCLLLLGQWLTLM